MKCALGEDLLGSAAPSPTGSILAHAGKILELLGNHSIKPLEQTVVVFGRSGKTMGGCVELEKMGDRFKSAQIILFGLLSDSIV